MDRETSSGGEKWSAAGRARGDTKGKDFPFDTPLLLAAFTFLETNGSFSCIPFIDCQLLVKSCTNWLNGSPTGVWGHVVDAGGETSENLFLEPTCPSQVCALEAAFQEGGDSSFGPDADVHAVAALLLDQLTRCANHEPLLTRHLAPLFIETARTPPFFFFLFSSIRPGGLMRRTFAQVVAS